MKKILISVMTLVLVIGLVGGGAFAYFSDTETSTGNVFTAGTIDLSEPVSVPIKMEDLKPCEVGYLGFVVHNDGTNEMDVWKHLYGVECDENEVNEPEEEYYIAHPESEAWTIDTVILYDMYVATTDDIEAFMDCVDVCIGECLDGSLEECLMECGATCAEWAPIVEPDEGLHIDDVECDYIYLGTLEPEEFMFIIQSYHMEGETENWAQSDEMIFYVEFYAEQLGGPGPTPELGWHGRP